MNTRSAVSVVAFLVLVPACALRNDPPLDRLPVADYAGHYTGGQPGESWFRPCGHAPGTGAWWVTWTDRSVSQRDDARARGQLVTNGSSFVRVRAAADTSGRVGPGGRGRTALLVRELLEARPAAATDCTGR